MPATQISAIHKAIDGQRDAAMAAFYRGRDYRPFWITGDAPNAAARDLLRRLTAARDDGLRPADYDATWLAQLAADSSGEPSRLAALDVGLSHALVAYLADLHANRGGQAITYVDRAVTPATPSPAHVLAAAAAAPSLPHFVDAASSMNPIYDGLKRGLALYRAHWSSLPQDRIAPGITLSQGDTGARVAALAHRLGQQIAGDRFNPALAAAVKAFQRAHGLPVTGAADPATIAALNRGEPFYEAKIIANMDRARALPTQLGERYVLVNTATAMLMMVDNGHIAGTMRVIVGKPSEPTPAMAALIRYAVFNPYWNVPPDLAAERARRVEQGDATLLAAQHLEVLSGWDDDARVLPADEVDWHAAAAGQAKLRMRQLPGADNMMGKVKFMLPNQFGVYLHDTPNKALFAYDDRRRSAGCIRLADAARLGRWLFDGSPPRPGEAPDEHVDLPQPVAVYITYFTALPRRDGVAFVPDGYDRDTAQVAELERRQRNG